MIGLNITFSHYLELELKEIKNKLEKYLDAIQVFINNFSQSVYLSRVKMFYHSLACLYTQASHDISKHFTAKL